MTTGILIGLTTETAGLHHRDKTRLDLEILSSSVDLRSGRNLGSRGSRVIAKRLLGHGVKCGWCNNDCFGCREWDLRRHDTSTNSSQKWLWIWHESLRQVEIGHTLPYFHINKDRNKAKLAGLASEYQSSISFITFAYVLQSMPSPAMAPKMLVGAYQRHLAMTPADANLGRQYFINHE